jgi:hypothetical protein
MAQIPFIVVCRLVEVADTRNMVLPHFALKFAIIGNYNYTQQSHSLLTAHVVPWRMHSQMCEFIAYQKYSKLFHREVRHVREWAK